MKRSNWTLLAPVLASILLVGGQAFAAEEDGYIAIGAGFAMGLAVLGASIGQGNAARGALEGMARNPAVAGTVQTAMLLGLAFIESLVIFTLIIAFFLQGKIG
jgi:F-type H+-transporting ATPase subunit c